MSMIASVETEIASSLALILMNSESRVSDVEDRTIALYDKTIKDLTERNQILKATSSVLEGKFRQLEASRDAEVFALQERIKLLENANSTLQQEVLVTAQNAQERILAVTKEKETALQDVARIFEARIAAVREEARISAEANRQAKISKINDIINALAESWNGHDSYKMFLAIVDNNKKLLELRGTI